MSKETENLAERIAAWWKAHPLPAPTGQVADKAFFDELCGEEEKNTDGRSPKMIPPKAQNDA